MPTQLKRAPADLLGTEARKDLLGAISADDLQGSVTRVRFARLSQIRTLLGCPPEENEIPADADVVVEDDEYIILDLVLNWVSPTAIDSLQASSLFA